MMERNRFGIWGGVVLIGLGLVFLIGQFFSINMWAWIWPLFILAVGAGFFFAMAAGGRGTGAFAIPGSILVTIGSILFVQNLFGIWSSWAYAWALIIAGAGVGLMIFGRWSSLPELQKVGRIVIMVGMAMFFLFGLFFEFGASLLGLRSPGGLVWPVLLILAGLYVLIGRPLLDRRAGPVNHSVMAFGQPGREAAGSSAPYTLAGEGVESSTQSISAGTVRRVRFNAFGDLTIFQGTQEGLEIEASQAVKERIRAEVQGDTLEIRYDQDWWNWMDPQTWNSGSIRYTLTLGALEHLDAAGFGNIYLPDLSAARLQLNHGGAGNLTVRRLAGGEVNVNLSGVGNVEIEGKVERQAVHLSGAGSYRGGRLESQFGRVELSGLGSAMVWVTGDLDARVSGAGSIEYYGSPRLSQHVSGLGSVRRLGERNQEKEGIR